VLKRRVIPCLLLDGRGLVKTVRFKDPVYVGDPINAVKIFNEKFVDEIIFLDITASEQDREPQFSYLAEIASECFIPFCYGGGVRSVEDARRIFALGVEKIAVNTAALERPNLTGELAGEFGSQSVIVAMDVHRSVLGRHTVMARRGRQRTSRAAVEYAAESAERGAGEILVNSVDRDGTQKGYDIELMADVCEAVTVPVIACGGAGELEHIRQLAVGTDVSAVAAGSLFVFKGRHRAVLINYPSRAEVRGLLKEPSDAHV